MKLSKATIIKKVYEGIEIDNEWSVLTHYNRNTMKSSLKRLFDYLERKGVELT